MSPFTDEQVEVPEMLIDCDSCEVRGPACGDCVVSVLLGVPDDGTHLDRPEQAAIGVLADAGLVPPLRLVVSDEQARNMSQNPSEGHLPQVRSAG